MQAPQQESCQKEKIEGFQRLGRKAAVARAGKAMAFPQMLGKAAIANGGFANAPADGSGQVASGAAAETL